MQSGGNFKGGKHQRSKSKKQDGGILPWLIYAGVRNKKKRQAARRRRAMQRREANRSMRRDKQMMRELRQRGLYRRAMTRNEGRCLLEKPYTPRNYYPQRTRNFYINVNNSSRSSQVSVAKPPQTQKQIQKVPLRRQIQKPRYPLQGRIQQQPRYMAQPQRKQLGGIVAGEHELARKARYNDMLTAYYAEKSNSFF
ncbi:Hypothetical predicted protein [Paramuricea clavata]|uniref:Uncharacterized protein n=1 Tax=Paramuricea clavata TaxID=317549 RepID=A0A6S7FQX8_PARCT|nr:Hypothetical predicted protein [Paramuricea clavata]